MTQRRDTTPSTTFCDGRHADTRDYLPTTVRRFTFTVNPKVRASWFRTWRTPLDLARILGVQRLTIYRWIKAGYCERKYIGRRSIRVRLTRKAQEDSERRRRAVS